ncbi:MAG: hypothetical protein WDN30_10780 [Pararobbsia sp.]
MSVAYLEAWLRVAPDDRDFIGVLAAQYLRVGRFADAERLADRMAASGDDDLRRSALLIKTGVAEVRAYGMAADDPARPAAMARLRGLLDEAARYNWQVSELHTLAERASAAGAGSAAMHFYRQLTVLDHDAGIDSQLRIAQLALGSQAYDLAAEAYFAAQSSVGSLDAQRRYFLSALAAFQSGGLLDQALAEGDRHLGRLSTDAQTIAALLNIARAAQPARQDPALRESALRSDQRTRSAPDGRAGPSWRGERDTSDQSGQWHAPRRGRA